MLGSHSPSKFSIRHDAVKQNKDTNLYQQDSPDSPAVRRQAQHQIVSEGGQQGIRSAQGAQTGGNSGDDGSSMTSFHRTLHQNTRGRLKLADHAFKPFNPRIRHTESSLV